MNDSKVTATDQSPIISSTADLRKEYETLIEEGASNPVKVKTNINKIRELVVLYGLPPETQEEINRMDEDITLRGKIWKILLGVQEVDHLHYSQLVQKGPSPSDDTIQLDAVRTLQHEELFSRRVTKEKVVRLLNAWQHEMIEQHSKEAYVQGLNAYVAPLLYVMPEPDTFSCFKILMKLCYLYTIRGIPGSYEGVKLFDEVLAYTDPELFSHLTSQNMEQSEIYAMQPIHGMNVGLFPYTEWIALWDVALCLGVHFHLIFFVSRVLLIREDLLATDNPNEFLSYRKWPKTPAKRIINMGMQIIRTLPEDLYTRIQMHPYHINNQ